MTTVKFDDILEEELRDERFKQSFLQETKRLDNAVALVLAREEQGYSQRELAELASVPQSTVARIEKGGNTSINTLSKIALALGKNLTISFS